MSDPYIIRVTRLSVGPESAPIFGELVTHFTIADEAGGEFVEVEQQGCHVDVKPQCIQVTREEWPLFRNALDRMMEEIDRHEKAATREGGGS